MTDLIEVPCPACGVAVRGRAPARVTCGSCHGPILLVHRDEFLLRARLPVLGVEDARRSFARLFERDGEPEPGPPETAVDLLFVPFYEISGTMAGVAPGGRAVHRWAQASIPAVDDRDDIGISEIEPGRLDEGRDTAAGEEGLFGRLRRHGTVLAPERDAEEAEAILAQEVRIPADGEAASLVDRRLALLYYPVWRLRSRSAGIVYQATVDGITGTVLLARLPAKQRRRIFNGVFAAACLGYVLGTMLRHRAMGLPGLRGAILRADPAVLLGTVGLATIGMGLYVLLLNAAWNSLRYRNELTYHSGLKTRLLVNRPVETLLDRVTGAVKQFGRDLVGTKRYDR